MQKPGKTKDTNKKNETTMHFDKGAKEFVCLGCKYNVQTSYIECYSLIVKGDLFNENLK
jgi:hypothetical protein